MHPARSNMFFVCVTVGLVLLASKYRKNVFQSVKQLCQSIKTKSSSKQNDNRKKDFKITLDKIILADTPEKCDYAIQRIRCNLSDNVLGFDCEWANEGPVSLLQLATFNGVCGLFRINKIGYIPQNLKELLASKQILKVGVASYEDGQKIIADHGCNVCSTLDLRTLAQRANLPCPKSLAAMSLQYLSLEMDKLIEVRCSDWDAGTLADEQVAYAACDAIASVLIYDQIVQRMKEKYSLWQNLIDYIKSLCNRKLNTQFHNLPNGIIDTRFRAQPTNTIVNQKNMKNSNIDKIRNMKDLNMNNTVGHKSNIPTRNKPLYHNCYLQAPDGEILCTCDRKKAEWYISKQLGEVIEKEPFTVRLKFEPSGRALGEVGQYYTQVKVNQCVVCGTSDNFIRKNVVPREYRKYFPLVMKAHQSHDILLLCPTCHEISNCHDLQLRRKLADMCDAPLAGPLTHVRNKYVHNWRKLHSAVKALRESSTLPDARRKELEEYILECTNKQQVTPVLLDLLNNELKNAMASGPNCDQSKCQSHGLKVVQYFQRKEAGLVELERMWREHFLLTMKPKYLPNLWSVRHNQERLSIRQSQNRIEPQDAKVAGLAY
ncbi:exonuclease 3'-5' domain-containing protein 2 [Ceratina calcarata]|uniref:Exonuclease 3'-5' domain-containing protein 2 n=1 Tax=Ceratina calcarata TaxID=156304 RepID=A0AAJ7S7R4_9HYME|nr:exonuclease 3'-5' domain-containing protein 2 [Ceratina calcarata]XP_026672467.1 exonuclease 3'-5' domain-containing protein 2 [Ceratina calcarata]